MNYLNKKDKAILLIILSASLVITYNYFHFVEKPNITARMRIHDSIIEREAPAPYRYRVLVPLATQGLAGLFTEISPLGYRKSWILSYIIYDFAAISLFLASLYYFLREWHSRLYSLIGVLFCCAVLPLSLRDHYFQPWSLIESWFFCAAFLAAYRERYVVLLILTLAASLNRMSGLFIPLIYLAATVGVYSLRSIKDRITPGIVGRFILLLAVSVTSLLFLRFLLGWSGNIHSIGYLSELNRSFPYYAYAIINIILFGGAWWIFFSAGIKHSDLFSLNMLPVISIYIIPVLIFGIWKEVRLLMPIYPILLSIGLYRFEEISGLETRHTDRAAGVL